MTLFHDEEDGPSEPVRGLPEALPEDERILWQGSPRPLTLAIHAFHLRFVPLYFAVATAWRAAAKADAGAAGGEIAAMVGFSALACLIAMAVVYGLAWVMARAAIFTITDKRVVMRYGAAIRKYVNLPFSALARADLRRHGSTAGSIALLPTGPGKVGYAHLWPFARPLKIATPQPMLRAIGDVDTVVSLLAAANGAEAPTRVPVASQPAKTGPTAPSGTGPIGAT